MKLLKKDFHRRELDELLSKWFTGQLSEAMTEEWRQILKFEHSFREDLCEFVKAMRDPAWSTLNARSDSEKDPS